MVLVEGTDMIEVGIDGLSRDNDLGRIMRGIETLKCIPTHLGGVVKIKGTVRMYQVLVGTGS